MTINALMPGALAPKFDLVGPTVDADVRRLIARYGAALVKEAVKQQTRAKRGRKALPDWRELAPLIDVDALDFLAGRDPFALRTNYSLAKEFTTKNPGHSPAATHERIEGKLGSNRYGRRWYVFARAMELSSSSFPYADHIRALEALASVDKHRVWQMALERARASVVDYTTKWGAPADELTMPQIEEGATKFVPGSSLSGVLDQSVLSSSTFGKILANAVDPTVKS